MELEEINVLFNVLPSISADTMFRTQTVETWSLTILNFKTCVQLYGGKNPGEKTFRVRIHFDNMNIVGDVTVSREAGLPGGVGMWYGRFIAPIRGRPWHSSDYIADRNDRNVVEY